MYGSSIKGTAETPFLQTPNKREELHQKEQARMRFSTEKKLYLPIFRASELF